MHRFILYGAALVVLCATPGVAGIITVIDTFTTQSACCLNANEQFLYNAPPSGASAPEHTFFFSNGSSADLGLLESGQFGATLLAMNNSAQFLISGQLGNEAEEVVNNGQAVQLQSWSPSSSFLPKGLNNQGVLVGYDSTNQQAATYANGQVTDLGTLSSYYNKTAGSLINDSGTVAGTASHSGDPNSPVHTFIYSNGTMTDIGSLGNNTYQYTQPNAINSKREIVGYSAPVFTPTISNQQAYSYLDGTMTALGTLGGTYSEAQGVNDQGDIVGFSQLAGDDRNTAFLYEDGTMIDLNSLLPSGSQWYLTDALSINDAGQILAAGYDLDNSADTTDTFLLQLQDSTSATPEPSSFALVATGVICALVGLRFRRTTLAL